MSAGTAPTHNGAGDASRWRLGFIAILVMAHVVLWLFPGVMTRFGVGRSVVWFRDMHSMLAASDSARAGYDPFVQNPYDVAGERHIYTDWWYLLGRVGLSRADSTWLGALTVIVFWLAVYHVAAPRSGRELAWLAVLCASPPFWLAVNRANPDLLVFALLTTAIPLMLHRREWVRHLAAGPVALATGLKFFPVLAGAVFFPPAASRAENRRRWLLLACLAAGLCWSLADDMGRYLEAAWVGRGLFTFGAAAIPLHFGDDAQWAVSAGRVCGVVAVLLAVAWPALRAGGEGGESATGGTLLYSLMGAAVLAGGFFLTVGYLYKIIFVVWLLPRFFDAAGRPGRDRSFARAGLVSLAGLVWAEGLVCFVLSAHPVWIDPVAQVLIRRTAATVAGCLAWVVVVAAVRFLGLDLRACWFRWTASSR